MVLKTWLAYHTNISGVLTVLEKSIFTRGTDCWHAQFDAGLLFLWQGTIIY